MDAFRTFEIDPSFLSTISHLINLLDLDTDNSSSSNNNKSSSTRKYVRDARAMAATPADIKELPSSYSFIVDMPGVKSGEIKLQVEDDNVLVISGERKREEGEGGVDEGGKWLRMERRMGKFMRKFVLPDNANLDGISAVCKDGVLTVTEHKIPPPEPKKPKTIQVAVA